MDRKKAIQILKRCEAESYCSHYKQHYCCIGCGQREALDLAIESLGQTEIVRCKDCEYCEVSENTGVSRCFKFDFMNELDDYCSYGERKLNNPTDLISRQAAIEAFDGVKVNENDCTEYDIGYNDGIDFAVSKLSVLPSAQPKNARKRTETHGVCSDCISRQRAIELACWRCKKCERKDCEYKDSCETMSLLEALPSEDPKPPMLNKDCISRQAAIDAVEKAVFKDVAKSAIESLPPVAPVAKTLTEEIVDFNNMISAGGRIRNLPPVEPPKRVVAQIKVDTEEIVERIKEEYEITDRPVCEDAISRADALFRMLEAIF